MAVQNEALYRITCIATIQGFGEGHGMVNVKFNHHSLCHPLIAPIWSHHDLDLHVSPSEKIEIVWDKKEEFIPIVRIPFPNERSNIGPNTAWFYVIHYDDAEYFYRAAPQMPLLSYRFPKILRALVLSFYRSWGYAHAEDHNCYRVHYREMAGKGWRQLEEGDPVFFYPVWRNGESVAYYTRKMVDEDKIADFVCSLLSARVMCRTAPWVANESKCKWLEVVTSHYDENGRRISIPNAQPIGHTPTTNHPSKSSVKFTLCSLIHIMQYVHI